VHRDEQSRRAVPRSRAGGRPDDLRREQAQQAQVQRQYRAEQQAQTQRQYRAERQYDARRNYDARRDNGVRRDNDVRRDYQRPYYPNRGYGYYSNRGYGSRTVIVPRYITPRASGIRGQGSEGRLPASALTLAPDPRSLIPEFPPQGEHQHRCGVRCC